jgi:hypothetical protein
MTEIKIKAQGASPSTKFTMEPDRADFDEILIGEKAKMNLALINKDSVKTKLVVVSAPSEEYVKKYKIKKDKLDPGQTTRVEFELQKNLPPGAFKTALTLQDGDRADTRITIPITGKVVEKLSEKKDKADSKDKAVAKPKPKTTSKKVPPKKPASTSASKQVKPKVEPKLDNK